MNIAQQFGRRVRELRQMKGMTQADVSLGSGINRTYLSRLERGEYKPQLDMIVLIAQGLRVTLSELFEEMEIVDSWEVLKIEAVPPRRGLR